MKKREMPPHTLASDEYLQFGIETLGRILKADFDRDSLRWARRAARLLKSRDVSGAVDSLVELARELDDRLATTGYLLVAVLATLASGKYLLDEAVAAAELQTASSTLYRRVARFRGSVDDTLDGLTSPSPRSRRKTLPLKKPVAKAK